VEFLKGSDTPDVDQRTFLKAQMVFWLLGATDGHAKNFSIRLAPGGRFGLTPLYDIISTQPSLDAGQIMQKQMKLAMAVGTNRHYPVHTIVGRHFVQTAKASGLPDKIVIDLIAELNDTAAKSIDQARAALPKHFPEKIAASIADGAKQRLKALAVVGVKD
jgi:serine/threonine-protein kinase HipA